MVCPVPLYPLPEYPLVSVLIANYNYAGYIGRAIESVLQQTYQQFEIIICDDGSRDNSLDVIQSYAARDQRITVIAQPNGGQAAALNTAFAKSRGDIIALLDADDEWFPEKLATVVAALRRTPIAGFVYHQVYITNSAGKILRVYPKRLVEGRLWELLAERWVSTYATASSFALHRSVADQVFPLPVSFRDLADAVIHERATMITYCQPIAQILGIWRQHGANLTGANAFLDPATMERHILKLENLLADKFLFAERFHGKMSINYEQIKNYCTGQYRCMHALWTGHRLSYQDVVRFRPGVKAWLWAFLFMLPVPVARRLYHLWITTPWLYEMLFR